MDDATYTASIGSRTLDLTFKEFELLKYLAQHPGRVFTRDQLLQEVWGYDYFGGTRTVDVHVRRLRAKLGPEHETLIGTVRNVGYRFVLPSKESPQTQPPSSPRRPGAEHGARRRARPGPSPRGGRRGRGREPGRRRAVTVGRGGTARTPARGEACGSTTPGSHCCAAPTSTSRSHPTLVATASVRRRPGRPRRGAGGVTAWSHADHPAAAALARRLGFGRPGRCG